MRKRYRGRISNWKEVGPRGKTYIIGVLDAVLEDDERIGQGFIKGTQGQSIRTSVIIRFKDDGYVETTYSLYKLGEPYDGG